MYVPHPRKVAPHEDELSCHLVLDAQCGAVSLKTRKWLVVVNYRSVADLNECIMRLAPRLPRDIDVIVGVPRSGMLAATLLALHLNLPVTDVDGLITAKPVEGGRRQTQLAGTAIRRRRRALIVDDSLNTGGQLSEVKARVASAGTRLDVNFAAIFVRPGAEAHVDYWGELLDAPRVFEWNLLHHNLLIGACVDIDGVLCRDPTESENDDGPRYLAFLLGAEPLVIPTVPIGWLVTSRLERYRTQTEQWLTANGVNYRELIMLDQRSAVTRRNTATHGQFKADVYSATGADLFIESDVVQALQINELTGKPVFCTGSRTMLQPRRASTGKVPEAGLYTRSCPPSLPLNLDADPNLSWGLQLQTALCEMLEIVPDGSRVLLLDESRWGVSHVLASRTVVPFTEKNGGYGGPPDDDQAAVEEFERVRDGIDFVVIGWPASWWLTHYERFAALLAAQCTTVLETPRLRILAVQQADRKKDVQPPDGASPCAFV
jgi:orotate phosphoribosyltransferase